MPPHLLGKSCLKFWGWRAASIVSNNRCIELWRHLHICQFSRILLGPARNLHDEPGKPADLVHATRVLLIFSRCDPGTTELIHFSWAALRMAAKPVQFQQFRAADRLRVCPSPRANGDKRWIRHLL